METNETSTIQVIILDQLNKCLQEFNDIKSTLKSFETQLLGMNTALNRIDVRTRNRKDQHLMLEERQKAENRCLEIWEAYLSGKLGSRVSNTKASYRDLLSFPRVVTELTSLEILSEVDIKQAIKNAKRRRNE